MAAPTPSSRASAGGKLILFGEHAVVYGKRAVATCLSDLRVMVTASARFDGVVEVSIPDVDAGEGTFSKEWRVEELKAGLGEYLAGTGAQAPQVPGPGVTTVLESMVEGCGPMNGKAIAPTVYLAAAILGVDLGIITLPAHVSADGSDDIVADVAPVVDNAAGGTGGGAAVSGVSVTIALPTLPVAAGLGSSAAFSVATAAAILDLHAQVFGGLKHGVVAADADVVDMSKADPQFRGGRFPQRDFLPIINEWSYCAEVLFHGRPSGLDNAVSCYGGALSYVSQPKHIDHLPSMPPMRLVVTNTKVPKDTKALVAGVRVLHDKMPAVVDPILDAIEAISERFVALASSSTEGVDVDATVGSLIDFNQGLLNALGVGHDSITALCSASKRHGMSSKLTGAGGGGCGFTLAPAGSEDRVPALEADLKALGYQIYESTAGGPGVLIHSTL